MNTTFNIERFRKLEKRDIYLSKSNFLYIIGALIGCYILSLFLYILTESSLSVLIYFISFLAISISPCFLEKPISKNSSVFDFIMPVSAFEKFLTIWIKYVIIVPAIVFGTIFILNLITGIIPVESVQKHTEIMSLAKRMSFNKFYSILAFQSIFLLGYFYFKKYAFAKTTLILIVAGILISVISISIASYYFHGQEATLNFKAGIDDDPSGAFYFGFFTGKSIGPKLASEPLIAIPSIIQSIIMPVGFWIVSYFKLKETEI